MRREEEEYENGEPARAGGAFASQDRVRALLGAVLSIGSDLDLGAVLREIVEAATALVDARYGALGVISEDRAYLAEFITVGVTEAEIDSMRQWPHGLGVLGLIIDEPHPLRLSDLSKHPQSHGFPAGHPPMSRILGVPIRVRGTVFGNLYLTEKAGGEEFTEEDERVVIALATAAGVAIENARLYQEARQRERWLEASAEISNALLSGTATAEVVGLVARRAREISGADVGLVHLVDEGGQEFVLRAADGERTGFAEGSRTAIEDSLAAPVYREGVSLLLEDEGPVRSEAAPWNGIRGPALIVPLGSGRSARGVLSVLNSRGRSAFTASTVRLLEPFAAQAAVALELAERRRDAERVVILEDRERIARDLHDTVIQRLFAIGMTLMSAIKITQKPEVTHRVQRAVDDLDDTIRQVRSTIFALHVEPGDDGLRTRIHAIAEVAAESLGFAPSVRLDGLLDTAVDPDTGEQLLAVLQEALSNVVRHASARQVGISVDVRDDLIVRVEDDGCGIPPDGRRSGLRNLADRARALGGTFSTRDGDLTGTVLTWQVPLS
ncbi:MAG: GAF domain-containing protein [Streptosporangiaceae bacterium]